jgi:hypothetical protein
MDNAEVTERKGVGLFFASYFSILLHLAQQSKEYPLSYPYLPTLATFVCIPLGKVRNLV